MLWRPLIRVSIALLAVQMPGTFLPPVLLPHVCFVHVPWAPTLEGQYIIKNMIIISTAIVIGGTVGARKQVTKRQRAGTEVEPFTPPAGVLAEAETSPSM